MNGFAELLRLLAPEKPTSGKIVAVQSPNLVLVRTRTSTVQCPVVGNFSLAIGDTVSLKDFTVIAKLADESTLPHYIV